MLHNNQTKLTMPINLASPKFSDIQAILDAVLARSNYCAVNKPMPPPTHGVFWRQTGDYDEDYKRFTTGVVPNVGEQIMNTTAGQELTSNFYVILTDPNGSASGYPQMPEGGRVPPPVQDGPFLTDAGYTVTVDGIAITGTQLITALAFWLTNNYPK